MSRSVKRRAAYRHHSPVLPRVAIMVDTSTSWGRRVVKGINNYSLKHQAWQFFVETRGLEEPIRLPRGWRGDGVIARVGNESMAADLQASRLPVVNVSGIQLPGKGFPQVSTDVAASAALALQHFLDRGFRHFAYFGLLGLPYVTAQQRAFMTATRKAGYNGDVYGVKAHVGAEPDWNLDSVKLQTWLKALPKPIGILTWNADSSRQLIYACDLAKLSVPEEVAVLSGSDDDLMCEVSHIPISAVLVAAEQIGYQAARLLDQMMKGKRASLTTISLKPAGIITRQSTDTMAIRDLTLVKALSFIRGNASQLIQVGDVTQYAGVSRRGLERKFAHVLGRSPADEIRRVHLERAKLLLLETDMPIPDVAAGAGFGSPEYMTYVFRTELKHTPLKYRRTMRGR